MRLLRYIVPAVAALACLALIAAGPPAPPPPPSYTPAAVFCAHASDPKSPLCSTLPGNIGPDPALNIKSFGYQGIMDAGYPTSFQNDVETPFDNYSWQAFVALNWKSGAQNKPASVGLNGNGQRVWQGYRRVAEVFGNSPIQANCHPELGEQVFSMGSKGDGTTAVRNEEYIQASTGDPEIDVNGNWALYERRLNNIEIAYLRAPGGNRQWDLTTLAGQTAFTSVATNKIGFPAAGSTPNGAMEIKASWRILVPGRPSDNPARFFTQRVMLAVSPELVYNGAGPHLPICAHVVLGLVGMHILQKNPLTTNALLPEWFWSTFEHVDNAPLADKACDITLPGQCKIPANQMQCPAPSATGTNWSFYNAKAPDVATNQPAAKLLGAKAFMWSPKQPYAATYLVPSKNAGRVGTQATRCWQIYRLTRQLNAQWQQKLKDVQSVFANYMLVGTQWGASTEATNPATFPRGAVPAFLSNTTLETYLQNYFPAGDGFNTGSCISCHAGANLSTAPNVLSDFSFLPSLVDPKKSRRDPMKPDAHPLK